MLDGKGLWRRARFEGIPKANVLTLRSEQCFFYRNVLAFVTRQAGWYAAGFWRLDPMEGELAGEKFLCGRFLPGFVVGRYGLNFYFCEIVYCVADYFSVAGFRAAPAS
jgi:hypothetical protein